MMRPPKQTAVLFIRQMPKHLKDEFKSYCARRGVSMTQMIIQLMQSCIEKEGTLDLRRTSPAIRGTL